MAYARRVSLGVTAWVVNTANPARAAYIAHINSAAARAWRRLRWRVKSMTVADAGMGGDLVGDSMAPQ
ncbi:hypothetical protein BB029_28475 [Pseudomonas sp. S3E12]|nr:hypothetical protein BB029_28475 [Pseudomonas sp. S3E12]